MLTVDQLKTMSGGRIFATGVAVDEPEGLHMANTGKELRWVAVKGGVDDWAIYCHLSDKDMSWIKSQGDKVHEDRHIKKLVPCDDEAFALYRH